MGNAPIAPFARLSLVSHELDPLGHKIKVRISVYMS